MKKVRATQLQGRRLGKQHWRLHFFQTHVRSVSSVYTAYLLIVKCVQVQTKEFWGRLQIITNIPPFENMAVGQSQRPEGFKPPVQLPCNSSKKSIDPLRDILNLPRSCRQASIDILRQWSPRELLCSCPLPMVPALYAQMEQVLC